MWSESDETLARLRRAVERTPRDAGARAALGLALCLEGLFDESLDQLRKAVELAPKSTEYRNHLGLEYCILGMYDEDRVEFEEVLNQDPGDRIAPRQVGFFY